MVNRWSRPHGERQRGPTSATAPATRRQRPVAVATVNRYMKLLHAVLRLGQRRGLIPTNPASPVQLARENNARNRYLSDDAALPDWFKPLVTVALHTGCRREELLGLQWKDVDLAGGTLHLRRNKAGDGRWVVLNAEAQAALRSLRQGRKVVGPFVYSVSCSASATVSLPTPSAVRMGVIEMPTDCNTMRTPTKNTNS